MKKTLGIILRAAIDVVFFTITIPIRICILAAGQIRILLACKKYSWEVSEMEGIFCGGSLRGLKAELIWIKTGHIKDVADFLNAID